MNKTVLKVAFLMLMSSMMICGCSDLPAGDSTKATEAQSTMSSSSTQATAEPKSDPAITPPKTMSSEKELKECNWTLHVDDTVPVTSEDGITVNYTLIIDAVKKGGKNDLGTYTGSASFSMKLDTSKLPSSVVQLVGTVEENLKTKEFTADVVTFDSAKYSDFQDSGAIAPIVKYDGMALISTPMATDGTVDLLISGPNGEKGGVKDSNNGTYTVNMRMTLEGGKVQVNLPTFPINKNFGGMITGTPVSY